MRNEFGINSFVSFRVQPLNVSLHIFSHSILELFKHFENLFVVYNVHWLKQRQATGVKLIKKQITSNENVVVSHKISPIYILTNASPNTVMGLLKIQRNLVSPFFKLDFITS